MMALLAAKIQKGTAIPSAAMTRPPSAGPAARPTLKPTPFKAVALSSSSLGTRRGVVAPQAGEVSAPPTPSRKVVASRSAGVARFSETRPAKITETARIASSTAISNRRESMTSAKAPDGRVNRNSGRLTATWTRDTIIGLASRLVISQPDAVSNMAVPTFDKTLAVHMTVNATEPNAPQREDSGRIVEGFWFAPKFVCSRGPSLCAGRCGASTPALSLTPALVPREAAKRDAGDFACRVEAENQARRVAAREDEFQDREGLIALLRGLHDFSAQRR